MLGLVKERFSDADAIDLVVGWVKELSATRTFGSKEPNVLGSLEFDNDHLFVLKGLLQGLSIEEIKARAAEGAQPVGVNRPIEEMANQLEALPVFKGILRPN
jgi:hypothetical protein